MTTPDPREPLGRLVRQVWVNWAREQPDAKPSWLAPWEHLTPDEQEVDMRIGEAIAVEARAVERERIRQMAASVAAEYVDSDPCSCGWDRCRGVIKNAHAPFADLLRSEP